MDGVDPETLLEWLQTGTGLERDLQLMALEQLCMLLLMSDNIDRCFESCPPRTFIPALCQIFLDETATENILEVTARAITYYLDVSNECTRRITQVEGAVKAICNRLSCAEMTDRTSKDLAEQCVKLLEQVCQREGPAVYAAGGLQSMLYLVRRNGHLVHKDTLHSAMAVVMRLCGRVEPQDAMVCECTVGLGELLAHEDPRVSESALRCFAALTDRYIRKSMDPSELAESSNLVEHLLDSLLPPASDQSASDGNSNGTTSGSAVNNRPSSFVSIVLSLLSNLCRGSARVTNAVVSAPKLISALKSALSNKDERCVLDSLRLADLLVILLCEGRGAFTKSNVALVGSDQSPNSFSYDRAHRYLIDVIRQRDTDALIDAVENGSVDPNFTDDVGQTLLNWCAAFGTIDMVQYLCDKGADVNRGQRSSSLHYAVCFGRSDVLIALLQNGANPDLRDEDGRTALDKARERADEAHQQVVHILESPSEYMMSPKKKRSKSESTSDGNEKRADSEDPAGTIESTVIRAVIQRLIPVFCVVFTDSMAASVCRATLSLINKCIKYCPIDAFEELVNGTACKENPVEPDDESSSNFVERLMKVVVTVFNEETNVEGHEHVIMILKSLFTKNHDFWLEQLIRLGIVDKVEQLAMQADTGEAQRQKIHELAKELWESPLKDARNKPRDVFVELRRAADELQTGINRCVRDWENFDLMPDLKQELARVRDLIVNERLLSTFELASSGVVATLLDMVRRARVARNGVIYETFYEVFEDEGVLSSMIRRIVEVLEFVEKFEPVLYDNSGAAFGLQLLTRRLRFTMHLFDPSTLESKLPNRTGRVLRTEPLATVGQLRSFLQRSKTPESKSTSGTDETAGSSSATVETTTEEPELRSQPPLILPESRGEHGRTQTVEVHEEAAEDESKKDETLDDDEMEEDASTADEDALHERRRQYHLLHDDHAHDPTNMLVDELVFIDARDVSGIHFSALNENGESAVVRIENDEEMMSTDERTIPVVPTSVAVPISAATPAPSALARNNPEGTSSSAPSSGFVPLRSDFVRILTEAAAARQQLRQSTDPNSADGSSSVAAILNHDFVMSMLESAGYRPEIPTGRPSSRASAASIVAISGASASAVSATAQQYRSSAGLRSARRPNRSWDDEYVLRRQFSALIPAFDPRPGRNNVNQTQDVELPSVDSPVSTAPTNSTRSVPMILRLSGPEPPSVTVPLDNDDETMFSAVQRLYNRTPLARKSTDRGRKIWEQTYTISYGTPTGDSGDDENADAMNTDAQENEDVNEWESPKNLLRQSLEVLRQLHYLAADRASDVSFISAKLTQKLQQELGDPLVVAAGAFPKWAQMLVYNFPCLFSLETRNNFLRATAFGTSRAIVWLQSRRDQLLEEARNSGPASAASMAGLRREDYPEFRIGRIKHERIKVHRSDEHLFKNAIQIMKFHASRKSVLEIEYLGEEGTGLGPTLEFYALVAAEFQRKSLAMFLCDDADEQQQRLEADSLDLGEGIKPPGYYVRRAGGLFPAPAPQGSPEAERIAEMFRILGIFLAKVLQDGRLVDLPLSLAFLRLLISDSVAGNNDDDLRSVCLDGLLGLTDLHEINEHKAKFLRAVQRICIDKARIRADHQTAADEKHRQMGELRLQFNGDDAAHECRVEDLGLTFVVNPPSAVFSYAEHELIVNGANVEVTIDNIELYLGKCVDFYLNSGIRQQVAAFRQGFDSVFPLRALKMLTPHEVQKLLSGEQCPEWTRDDLINFTEPKLGYTRDSPGFLRFVEVVAAMSPAERKAFLQFTTGCSSLPPGGLANLHPRLTVVRKVDSGGDGSYPSVNTCVHYLKLPDYSSVDVLRERLLAATHEKGFHLN